MRQHWPYVFLLVLFCFSMLWIRQIHASELTHQFSSPAFSGVGFSSHVLSLEQLSFNRKAAIEEQRRSDALRVQREAESTTLARFLTNVESRIFATLSKQLVDSLFSEGGATSGTIEVEGNLIAFSKVDNELRLIVTEPDGGVTQLTIPIGEFGF